MNIIKYSAWYILLSTVFGVLHGLNIGSIIHSNIVTLLGSDRIMLFYMFMLVIAAIPDTAKCECKCDE